MSQAPYLPTGECTIKRSPVPDKPVSNPAYDRWHLAAGSMRVSLTKHSAQVRAELSRPDKHVLFPVGNLFVGIKGIAVLRVATEEIDAFLARHAAGDSGQHGIWTDLSEEDVEKTDPARRSVRHANRLSQLAGKGLVISRYSLFRPDVDGPRNDNVRDFAAKPRRRNAEEYMDVATLLDPSGNKTLAWTSLEHVQI